MYATEDDIIDKLYEKLKKEKNMDSLTREDIEDFYSHLLIYMNEVIDNDPYCSVNLGNLGTAYIHRKTLSKLRSNSRPSTKRRKKYDTMYNEIYNSFEKNQPFINSYKNHRYLHVVDRYDDMYERAGILKDHVIEETNKIQ